MTVTAAPIRVGILNDLTAGPPDPANIESWLRRVIDEYVAAGRLDRDVEFVYAWGLGLPSGTAAAVERALKSLVDQDVLLIVGPAIGDNALAVTPLVEALRVPTINWAGTERARGEYMFHLQVGSHEDESIVLARYLQSIGTTRVGVVHDRSPIGQRYLQFLQAEADVVGLRIVSVASIAPLADRAAAEVAHLLDGNVDAIAYLGLGIAVSAVARELAHRQWHQPRVLNTAGLRGYSPEFARAIDGWVYVDMHSDHNKTLRELRRRWGVAPRFSLAAAKGFDLGRLIAEGLSRASERTREGVKAGLELVKYMPAAEGHEGTLLGFGKQDRGALHGRYLVLRQWRNGETVEVRSPDDL
jgi:ABC-type branched-subunit amino acid transport system substrate-binding protein